MLSSLYVFSFLFVRTSIHTRTHIHLYLYKNFWHFVVFWNYVHIFLHIQKIIYILAYIYLPLLQFYNQCTYVPTAIKHNSGKDFSCYCQFVVFYFCSFFASILFFNWHLMWVHLAGCSIILVNFPNNNFAIYVHIYNICMYECCRQIHWTYLCGRRYCMSSMKAIIVVAVDIHYGGKWVGCSHYLECFALIYFLFLFHISSVTWIQL